jgi:carboxymethylenebutenolidase
VTARRVTFRGGDRPLRGLLYEPVGPGPFPAVVWNHGSEQLPDPRPELAELYLGAGYVLFLPHRRGHGASSGEYPIADLRRRLGATDRPGYRADLVAGLVELHERYLDDTSAAFEWLARRRSVDASRIAVSGVSHGAIQALLAARDGAAACVPFAPAAMAWRDTPELRDWLAAATRDATAPVFLLQARNDYDLGPSEVLGAVLDRKGPPNRSRLYEAYGETPQAGHAGFACQATAVWGADVLDFLAEAVGVATPVGPAR